MNENRGPREERPHNESSYIVRTGETINTRNPTALRIAKEVRAAGGSIAYSRFMNHSLFGPDGYYAGSNAEVVKNFYTSSTRSTFFGETIGHVSLAVWERMECPKQFDFMEIGAGTGAASDALLHWARTEKPDFYHALRPTIIDYGNLISQQKKTIRDRDKVRWIKGSAITIPLPEVNGVIFRNEVDDSLETEVVTRIKGKVKQKYIGVSGDEWIEVWKEPSDEVASHIKNFGVPITAGVEEPINLNSVRLSKNVNAALAIGAIITSDYGEFGPVGVEDAPAIRIFGHPALSRIMHSELKYPGKLDMTSDVDFSIQRKIAQEDRLSIAFAGRQKEFLLKNGINDCVQPTLAHIRSTRSWDTVLQLSNELDAYLDLLGDGDAQVGDYCVQVSTRGIDLSFPETTPPLTAIFDTGVVLRFNEPHTSVFITEKVTNLLDMSIDIKRREGITNAEGAVPLEQFGLLPHELVTSGLRDVTITTRSSRFSTGRGDRFNQLLRDSEYHIDK